MGEIGEGDLGYRRTGALIVADDTNELVGLQRLLVQRRTETPAMGEVSLLSVQQAVRMFPPLRRDYAAVLVSGGARVDGRRMAAGMLRGAVHFGAMLRTGHAALVVAGGRVRGAS